MTISAISPAPAVRSLSAVVSHDNQVTQRRSRVRHARHLVSPFRCLANDSRNARPSIFNDDDEFSLLTNHDELLLKMLYDPRLEPGMTAREAEPITRIIARELTVVGSL